MNFISLHSSRKHLRVFASFVLLASMLLGSQIAHSQIDKEFWFAAPYASEKHGFSGGDVTAAGGYDFLEGGNKPLYLKLSTLSNPATVTVSMPANGNFVPIEVEIGANKTATIDLTPFASEFVPNSLEYYTNGNVNVENKGLYIASTDYITAYYEIATIKNPDLFSLKGKNALGTKFYTPFQNQWYNQDTDCWGNDYSKQAYSAIDIVATEDGTKVWITSPVALSGDIEPGVRKEIVLNKGQTYTARAMGQGKEDHPTGALIESSAPIAVTIKDDSAVINAGKDDGEDLIGDQLIPVELTGTEYIVMQGNLNDELHERFFVVATEDDTELNVGGFDTTLVSAGDNGSFVISKHATDKFVRVTSTKPVYVFHVSGYDQEMAGAVLPPINKCTGSDQIGFTRTYGTYYYEKFFMNILVKKGAEGNFLLDGAPHPDISADAFTPIPGSEWSAARIEFTKDVRMGTGQHLLQNTEDFFHMAFVNTTVHEWRDKGEWSEDGSEIIWNTEYPGTNICGEVIFPAEESNVPRLIGAIYGYFSNFDVSEPGIQFVKFDKDTIVLPLEHEAIALRAYDGRDYEWFGEQKSGDAWVAMTKPYHLDATVGQEVEVSETLPEGEYRYYASIETRCFGRVTDTVYIKIVNVPAPRDITDYLCDDPDGSFSAKYHNLENLTDTILGKDGIAAGNEVTGWYYPVRGDSITLENYDDSRLVTDLTAGYSANMTNATYTVEVNPDGTDNVGYMLKSASNSGGSGPIINNGQQVVIELEMPADAVSAFAEPFKFELKKRYDGLALQEWELQRDFYITLSLVNDEGTVQAELTKPIPSSTISNPEWKQFVFDFAPAANQVIEFTRVRITIGMDFYKKGLGWYIDDLVVQYDDFLTPVQNPTSLEVFDKDTIYAEVTNNDLVQYGVVDFVVDAGRAPINIDLGIHCSETDDFKKVFDIEQYNFYGVEGSLIAEKVWYHDEALTDFVSNPSAVEVQGNQTYYAKILDHCENVAELNVEVVQHPDMVGPTETFCAEPETDGTFRDCVDLTEFNSIVCANASENATYEWYSDADYLMPVTDPTCAKVIDGGVYYVKVTNYAEDGTNPCVSLGILNTVVNPAPVPVVSEIPDYCNYDDQVILSSFTDDIGTFYINGVEADYLVPTDYENGAVLEIMFETVLDGCRGQNIQTVEIFAAPKITFPEPQKINYGETAEINATITEGSGNYSYSWIPVDKLEDAAIEDPTTVSLFETTTFRLEVVDLETTTDGCVANELTSVIVIGGPVEVEIIPDPAEICVGQSSQLVATVSGGTGTFTYEWTSIPSGFTSDELSPVVSPIVNTVYYLKVTDANAGEEATAEASVKVNRVPVIELDQSEQYTCNGIDKAIEVDVDAATATFDVEWSGSTVIIGDVTDVLNPTIDSEVFNLEDLTQNKHILNLKVTDENECVANEDITILVRENPSVAVEAELPYCQGLEIPLNANTSGGTEPYEFEWLTTGVDDATAKSPIYKANDFGTLELSVNVIDAYGCTDAAQMEVEVLEKPKIVLNDSTYCQNYSGISGLISPISISPEADYVYSWEKETTTSYKTIGNERSQVLSLENVDQYNLRFIVQYDNDDEAAQCRDTAFALIDIKGAPVAEVSMDKTTCQNDTLTLTGSNDSAYDYEYEWSGPGADYLTVTDDFTTQFYNEVSGDYDLVYTQTRVYENISCPTSVPFKVSVIDTTIVTLYDTAVCALDTLEIKAELDGAGGYNIVWVKNENALTINNAIAPKFVSSEANEYTLGMEVTDLNGCVSYSEMDVTVYELPSARAGQNDTIDYKAEFFLDGRTSSGYGDLSYRWMPDHYLETPLKDTTNGSGMEVSQDYILEVTDGHGCVNEDTVRVTVIGGPIQVSVEESTICKEYEEATLDAIASGGNGGGFTFQWYEMPNEVDIVSTEQTFKPQPDETTVYKVIAYSGDITPDTTYTTVYANPSPDISFEMFDGEMCHDDQQVIKVKPCDPTYEYEWTVNETNVILACDYDFLAVDKGVYDISVKVTDENKCHSTIDSTVRVFDNPVVDIEVDSKELCAKTEMLLEAVASGGNGAPYIYTWNNNPYITPEGEDGSAVIYSRDTDALQDEVTVVVEDENGCIAEDTETLTVFPLPIVASPDLDICTRNYEEIKLKNSDLIFAITDGDAYQNLRQLPDGTGYEIIMSEAGVAKFEYSATDERGCELRDSFEVVAYARPVLTLPAPYGCSGANIETVVESDLTVNYWHWELSDPENGDYATVGGQDDATEKYRISETNSGTEPVTFDVGINALKLYTLEDDEVLYCSEREIFPIKVNPNPEVEIVDIGKIPYGTKAEVTAEITKFTTSEVVGDYKFDWNDDQEEKIESGDGTPVITTISLSNNEAYWVKVTDQNGCYGVANRIMVVDDRPQIQIILDTVCQYKSTSITYNIPGADANTVVKWTVKSLFGDDVVYDNGEKNLSTIMWDEYGDFEVCAEQIHAKYPAQSNCVPIHVVRKPVVEIIADPVVCEDDRVLFEWKVDTEALVDSTFEWRVLSDLQNGLYAPLVGYDLGTEGSQEFVWDTVGAFAMQLIVKNNDHKTEGNTHVCESKSTFGVVVNPNPEVSFRYEPEQNIYVDEWVDFINTTYIDPLTGDDLEPDPNVEFYWDFIGDDIFVEDEFNTVYMYDQVGDYPAQLMAVNTETGCKAYDIDTVPVVINPNCKLVFPNAFTPTKDTDKTFRWGYKSAVLEEGYQLRIYNRWGDLIWETDRRDESWDGSSFDGDANQDVYIYQCKFLCEDGSENFINGDVTLMK